jgi:hypothetical protein
MYMRTVSKTGSIARRVRRSCLGKWRAGSRAVCFSVGR